VREQREAERRSRRHRETLRDARCALSEAKPIDRDEGRPGGPEPDCRAAGSNRKQHRGKERDEKVVFVKERDDEW